MPTIAEAAAADVPPTISIVVPLRDEGANVESLHRRIVGAIGPLGCDFEILFVDDGSTDATPALIERIRATDGRVAILRLSRNFGHQPAVTAGLDHARGLGVVVMDGDLQDPPEVVPRLIQRWRDGFDVVYAIRTARKEAAPLRLAYAAFYRLLNAIADIDIPLDSGDFCLMDRRVVEALRRLPERVRFVRGLRTFVGFRQVGLAYERAAREGGRPKYTLRALFALAIDGVVSFSGRPLRLVSYLGAITAAVAAGMLVWVLSDAIVHRTAPRGWASLIATVLMIGSIQMIALGIVGEYIRLIFLEAKGRPAYVVGSYQPARGGDSG